MKKKSILTILFALAFTLLVVVPAAAGGWAVITLDALPDQVVAGENVEIGFTVRQHGINPMADLRPSVIATHTGTSGTFSVAAKAQGETGHYAATLNFPHDGLWDWSIQAFTMDQPMPPLTVFAAPGEPDQVVTPQISPIWVVGIGLLASATALLLFARKRVRGAAAFLILALLFTGGGIALAAGQSPEARPEDVPARSLAQQGEALFLAKGCITCHAHIEITEKFDFFSGVSGPSGEAPNLSQYAGSPDYLRLWLADPAKIKPDTIMPDLGLTSEEIEALIAFLVEDPTSNSTNGTSKFVPKNCPATQQPDPPFIPSKPYPAERATAGEFWYGTDGLWTMLPVNGSWQGLPYHKEGEGHYFNKVFWWNKDYDWQAEPIPAFTVTARRLDGPAPAFETSEATNAYTPEFGSAILTGVEIPTSGCWEFTGSYQDHELSFVVWVAP